MNEEGTYPATGVGHIAAERARQIEVEDYAPEHDRLHTNGALAFAAAVYAAPEPIFHLETGQAEADVLSGFMRWHEPWPYGWKRSPRAEDREGRIRELVKAGALIAAEIDRLLAQEAL